MGSHERSWIWRVALVAIVAITLQLVVDATPAGAASGVTTLPGPTVSIGDATVVEGDGGTATASFAVRLSEPSTLPVSVNFSTTDGTATTAGKDYVARLNKTLTLPAGKKGGYLKVTVIGDARTEPNETFALNFSNPVNGVLGRSSGAGTILDDDTAATPRVSVGDVTVVEGDAGNATASFDVTLDQSAAATVMVPWSTSPGSATRPSDYSTTSGTLSFPAGTTSLTISIAVKGETLVESTETATVNLGVPTGAVVADGSGTLTILDDDTTPSATALSIGDVALTEGDTLNHNASFPVRLAQPAAANVTVDYATTAGSATATDDYTTKTGTLTILAGAVSGSVKVPVVADGLAEGPETFTVALSNPTGGATLGRSVGTATIVDDDPASSVVGIGEGSTVEGNAGGTLSVIVPLRLSQPAATTVTVVVNSANGTATGADFSAVVNEVLTIAAGTTRAHLLVSIKSDTVAEPDEIFTLTLSSPSGATIGRATGTFTILNDD